MNLFDTALPGSFASTLYRRIDSTWLVILPLIQSTAFHRLQPPISNNLLNRNSFVRVGVGHSIHEALHWCFEAGEGLVGWKIIGILSNGWSIMNTHPLIVRLQESDISGVVECCLPPRCPTIEQSEPNYCTGPDIKLAGVIVSCEELEGSCGSYSCKLTFLLEDFRRYIRLASTYPWSAHSNLSHVNTTLDAYSPRVVTAEYLRYPKICDLEMPVSRHQ